MSKKSNAVKPTKHLFLAAAVDTISPMDGEVEGLMIPKTLPYTAAWVATTWTTIANELAVDNKALIQVGIIPDSEENRKTATGLVKMGVQVIRQTSDIIGADLKAKDQTGIVVPGSPVSNPAGKH